MHALTILRRCLGPLLGRIHRRRLATLLEAVAATVSGPRLTLTDIGRRFASRPCLRHKIQRAHSKRSRQSARGAREAWLLVASTRLADWPAKRLVRAYRQRMQTELSFRDMKSEHFGEGLERSASNGTGRFTVLVLIASLAAVLPWLIGTAAQRSGLDERMRPNSRKRRAYSRLVLARLLLTLDGQATVVDLIAAIGRLDQSVASDRDALLAQ